MSLLLDPVLSVEAAVVGDKGKYFVALNATPGTAVTFAVNASVSETAGYFLSIKNTEQANGKRVYVEYIRLICAVAPASATSGEVFVKLDTTGYSSGGTGGAITPVCVNSDLSPTSVTEIRAGALTTAARSGSPRLLSRAKLRAGIPVVGDEWLLYFGADEFEDAATISGAGAQRMSIGMPPFKIGRAHV